MTPDPKASTPFGSAEWTSAISQRLERNQPVRRTLPERGRLHIDRQLPFLCVYRRPTVRPDAGAGTLVTGTASYLVSTGSDEHRKSVRRLVTAVVETLSEPFGAFLLLELATVEESRDHAPLRFHVPKAIEGSGFGAALQGELEEILRDLDLPGAVERVGHPLRTGLPPLLAPSSAKALPCTLVQLEIAPFFRDSSTGQVYPELLRRFRRSLTRTLDSTSHRFSRSHTTRCPVDHHMLGRRAVVQAVWQADEKLAEVSEAFDFLLQVTPINAENAWEAFQNSGFDEPPAFRYRPLPTDPVHLKRQLWSAPVERIEDPTLTDLFRQKQDELDREVTLLQDLESRRFVHGASQIFGEVEPELLDLARAILALCPITPGDDTSSGAVTAQAFAELARAEIEFYRGQWEGVEAPVEVRIDIARGLLVSRGSLLVGEGTRVPARRVEALLSHEVGTHLLTYANGKAQRFRLLATGLAGYDAFQEGLAVLSEHLVGGLTLARLRLLAARVVGVHAMLGSASFIEVFQELTIELGFEPRTAFTIAMRIFRGGGLTKDAAYLRGLSEVLAYLAAGGELEPLWIGKIASGHVGVIRELILRDVLDPPKLRPRYLELPMAQLRLDKIREGMQVLDLIPDARACS